MRLPLTAALLLLAPAILLSAPPAPVTETEPDGFTTPAPQAVGVLGAGGLDIEGTLDPTSPTGLDPGDRDGFSFTVDADGPFAATVDGGPGASFLLSLAREGTGGLEPVATVLGAAPLTLAVPSLEAGPTFRLGVAAMADGSPLPYALALRRDAVLPGWSGELCAVDAVSAEPDGSPLEAADLGYFTGVLCGSGELDAVVPPGGEGEGDEDYFRFRNVLPVPVRVRFLADPGLLRVEVQSAVFVGVQPLAAAAFGEAGSVDLPPLAPGSDYVIRVGADQGTAPLRYSFVVEPVAPPPPPEPAPLAVLRARVRLDPGGTRTSFRVDGVVEPGTGLALDPAVPFGYALRGAEQEFASGLLRRDARGRLWFRGFPGTPGLRLLRFDPVTGKVKLRGKGIAFTTDAADPSLDLTVTLGDLVLGADPEGEIRAPGNLLVVKSAE